MMALERPPVAELPAEVAELARAARVDSIKSGLLSAADVLALDPPRPMVGDWLDAGMVGYLVGKYGSLKSFAALGLCCSVATGKPWLDEPIHQTGPVVYMSLEGAYTLGPRLKGWLEHNELGLEDLGDLHVWADKLDLRDPADIAAWIDWAQSVGPKLIVIDTMAKAIAGADENSGQDMGMVDAALADLRTRTGAAVLTVHHTGHSANRRGRGHSSMEDNSDIVLAIDGKASDGPVLLESVKQKARENPPPKSLKLDRSPTSNPVLVLTSERRDNGDEGLKMDILAMVTKHPGELKKSDLWSDDSRGRIDGASRDRIKSALKVLEGAGRIAYVKRWTGNAKARVDMLSLPYLDLEDEPLREAS